MLCQGGDGCSGLGKFGPQEVVGVLFHVTLANVWYLVDLCL